MSSVPPADSSAVDLASLIESRAGDLRSADVVMASRQLGAARSSRFSFNRSMLRRAFDHGWRVTRTQFEIDAAGRGHAVYRIDAEGYVFHFVAFAITLDEAQHTDRVVANAWEITGALVETDDGTVPVHFLDELSELLPKQEAARFDPRVLVLTRGNRSVRFFDSLVTSLAAGCQPDADRVADAGYIMRSTAFYGNGKFGMKSFGGYEQHHPLEAPYRAQMLAAWLFRELSYDVVERCAQLRGGPSAVGFDDEWRRYFGLGNATGLGLVPYAFKHPKVLNAWAVVREVALADVRAMAGTTGRLERLRWWIERARVHFAQMGSDDRAPWLSPTELSETAGRIRRRLDELAGEDRPFDALYNWARADNVETSELVVALLIELDDGITDPILDRLLVANERTVVDKAMTVRDVLSLIDERYGWIDDLGLAEPAARHNWWVISDNTEEPRRLGRDAVPPQHREVAIDVAVRVWELRAALIETHHVTLGEFLVDHPDHGLAARRVVGNDQLYGEPRDNPCAAGFLPLDLQRFQLAMYGMDNFSPKSTDWLRVTLNQGAPRVSDLNEGNEMNDDWFWPPRPATAGARVGAA